MKDFFQRKKLIEETERLKASIASQKEKIELMEENSRELSQETSALGLLSLSLSMF